MQNEKTSNLQPPTTNGSSGEVWVFNESEAEKLFRIFDSSIQKAKRNALNERRHPTGETG
jgi:hypothetical protein